MAKAHEVQFESDVPQVAQHTFQLWRHWIGKHSPIYFIGTLSVIMTNVTEVALPKFIQWTVDLLQTGPSAIPHFFYTTDSRQSFFRLLAVLGLLLAGQFVARIVWRLTLARQTHWAGGSLRSWLWNRARYLPEERLQSDLSPGELMNIATSDIGTGRFTFGFTMVGSIDFFFLFTLTLTAMIQIDAALTGLSLILLPTIPWVMTWLAKKESAYHTAAQEKLSRLTDLTALAVGTLRMQRLTQTGGFWQARLIEAAEIYRRARLKVSHTGLAFIPAVGLTPLISYALLAGFGIPKVMSGELSLGSFIALQSYIFLIQDPLTELGFVVAEWQRGFASLRRVTHTLAQTESAGLRSGGKMAQPSHQVLSVQDLEFGWPGIAKPLIHQLSFDLREGGRLGITGPVGSGKTTLIRIIAGLEHRFSGTVHLWGHDVRSYNHSDLRKKIAVVSQKPFLFASSLHSNLCLHTNFSEDEIWATLEQAGVADDVRKLPDGLQTYLGEWGVNLSGGQKQRLTLARALLHKPKLMLMDDCLSAVDTVTEEKILNALSTHLSAMTVVWVAHRPSTLRHCEKIISLGTET